MSSVINQLHLNNAWGRALLGQPPAQGEIAPPQGAPLFGGQDKISIGDQARIAGLGAVRNAFPIARSGIIVLTGLALGGIPGAFLGAGINLAIDTALAYNNTRETPPDERKMDIKMEMGQSVVRSAILGLGGPFATIAFTAMDACKGAMRALAGKTS